METRNRFAEVICHGLMCYGAWEVLNALGVIYRLQVLGGLAQ